MKLKTISGMMLTLLVVSMVMANIATVLAPSVGDITGPEGVLDGTVDLHDLRKCAKAFGSAAVDDPTTSWNETALWDPDADVAPLGDPPGDGHVNIFDLRMIAKHYGETDP